VEASLGSAGHNGSHSPGHRTECGEHNLRCYWRVVAGLGTGLSGNRRFREH
jgi:hypothetical protein